jgi:hypothetical protein
VMAASSSFLAVSSWQAHKNSHLVRNVPAPPGREWGRVKGRGASFQHGLRTPYVVQGVQLFFGELGLVGLACKVDLLFPIGLLHHRLLLAHRHQRLGQDLASHREAPSPQNRPPRMVALDSPSC